MKRRTFVNTILSLTPIFLLKGKSLGSEKQVRNTTQKGQAGHITSMYSLDPGASMDLFWYADGTISHCHPSTRGVYYRNIKKAPRQEVDVVLSKQGS